MAGGGFDAPESGGGLHKQKKYKKGKNMKSKVNASKKPEKTKHDNITKKEKKYY